MDLCEQALELLSARLDAPLSELESAQLSAHLTACPPCRALAEELALICDELAHLSPTPPEDLVDRAVAALPPRRIAARLPVPWVWVAAAAAVAMISVGHGMFPPAARFTYQVSAAAPQTATSFSTAKNGAPPAEMSDEFFLDTAPEVVPELRHGAFSAPQSTSLATPDGAAALLEFCYPGQDLAVQPDGDGVTFTAETPAGAPVCTVTHTGTAADGVSLLFVLTPADGAPAALWQVDLAGGSIVPG